MKNRIIILLIIVVIILISYIFFMTDKVDRINSDIIEKNNSSNELIETHFTRTFIVLEKLEKADETGQYGYIVLDQFQVNNPTVVKIKLEYLNNMIKNNYYEISFRGEKNTNKKYDSIDMIFNSFEIIDIVETNKEGLNQIQDDI